MTARLLPANGPACGVTALDLLDGPTEPLDVRAGGRVELRLVVGRGTSARGVRIGDRSLSIGSGDDNDLVLVDRAVSARHCVIERRGRQLVVRDLASRNGTFVDGVRVREAHLFAGTTLRLGRTDVFVVPRSPDPEHVVESPSMRRVMAAVERYARLSWPVLVLGESGAGKEAVARALHERGPRAAGPYVALNAGGLSPQLVESELFGHERGAFTGADTAHRGAFEQADGGTLFLDELGELPAALQARLLRVLDRGELRRVGAESPRAVDVRVVCATHRELREMVAAGTFRHDLYYRLSQLVVEVPPLRERPEDVAALARHFLQRLAPEVGSRVLSDDALGLLSCHRWPGNARELRNVVSTAAVVTAGRVIEATDVRRALERVTCTGGLDVSPAGLETVLRRHRGNVSAAARALGLPRSTLRDRLKGPVKARR